MQVIVANRAILKLFGDYLSIYLSVVTCRGVFAPKNIAQYLASLALHMFLFLLISSYYSLWPVYYNIIYISVQFLTNRQFTSKGPDSNCIKGKTQRNVLHGNITKNCKPYIINPL